MWVLDGNERRLHRSTEISEIAVQLSISEGERTCGKFEDGFYRTDAYLKGERHCISAVAFMVVCGGLQPSEFVSLAIQFRTDPRRR